MPKPGKCQYGTTGVCVSTKDNELVITNLKKKKKLKKKPQEINKVCFLSIK